MRFYVVEFRMKNGAVLAVERNQGLLPLNAPADLRLALETYGEEGLMRLAQRAKGQVIPPAEVVRWFPPVRTPRTFRDFYAFEQHVKASRSRRGLEMIPEWYEIPVFYFSNPCALTGHLEPVRRPASSSELDFELELGCVIGRQVRDVAGEEAEQAIFGWLVLNDLSARDLQRQEMKLMLGPAKGKDFATAIGPCVVTSDELAEVRIGPGRYDLTMRARKNGVQTSRANAKDITHDFTRMIERASRDVTLHPGDLIGSGTVGTGCILELGPEATNGWLKPGDVIELEIDRLGILTTPIV